MATQKKPIRILHVVTIMNRAGLETMLMNYYRHIDRSKVQFDFLVHRSEKGHYDDEILKHGGKIYYAPAISPRNLFKYKPSLDAFFAKHPEYTIVHSHLDALSALPLAAAKRAGVPVRIAHAHANGFDHDAKRALRYFAKTFIPRYATDYFGCSSEAAEFMFGTDKKYTVIKNAIDTEKFAFNLSTRNRTRKALGLQDNFVVGHVGRFSYPKNHTFLIDIFAEVHKLRPEARLMLVGEGELEDEIRHKVQSLGLTGRVLFMGSREDVSELMQAMDVFVMPSHYEGLGTVLIEAQVAGLSCIAASGVSDSSALSTSTSLGLELSAVKWAEIISQKNDHEANQEHPDNPIIKDYEIRHEASYLANLYRAMYSDSNKCRVLIFGLSNHRGGVESFVFNHVRNIDASKFSFDYIVYDKEPAYAQELKSLGGNIYVFPSRRKAPFRHNAQLRQFFKQRAGVYSAIWCNLCSLSDIKPLKLAKKHEISHRIIHSHNSENMGSALTYILHSLNKRMISRYANYFFACSTSAATWFYPKRVIKNSHYRMINNAIETSRYAFDQSARKKTRESLGLDDKIIIGHVGRFHEQKNHMFLVDIFKEVHLQEPNSVLLLVGDGKEMNNIVAKINRLNLKKNVIILGPRDDVYNLMQAMDIFVLPSHYEGLPVVLVEAQCSGLYCIVSDSVTPEVAVTPLVIPMSLSQRADKWSTQIIKYLGNERRDQSSIIRAAGYDIVENCSIIEGIFLEGQAHKEGSRK